MSKTDFYTDEIINDLKPFDVDHNRRHIRLVVARLIGDDAVSDEKRAKFEKYVKALHDSRQTDLPPTEGTPYRINIIDTSRDLVEDKLFLIEFYELLRDFSIHCKNKIREAFKS